MTIASTNNKNILNTWSQSPNVSWKYTVLGDQWEMSRIKNERTVVYRYDENDISNGAAATVYKIYPLVSEKDSKKGKVVKKGSVNQDYENLMYLFKSRNFQPIKGILLPPKAFFESSDSNLAMLIMSKYDSTLFDWSLDPSLNIKTKISAFLQVIAGLRFLHEHELFHSDIKPDNILYRKKDERFDLADFGTKSRLPINLDEMKKMSFEGTFIYFTNQDAEKFENLKNGNDLKKCRKFLLAKDIFALGITMKVILLQQERKGRFKSLPNPDQEQINQEEMQKYSLPIHLVNLINKMLSSNWEERPSIQEIEKLFSLDDPIVSTSSHSFPLKELETASLLSMEKEKNNSSSASSSYCDLITSLFKILQLIFNFIFCCK